MKRKKQQRQFIETKNKFWLSYFVDKIFYFMLFLLIKMTKQWKLLLNCLDQLIKKVDTMVDGGATSWID